MSKRIFFSCFAICLIVCELADRMASASEQALSLSEAAELIVEGEIAGETLRIKTIHKSSEYLFNGTSELQCPALLHLDREIRNPGRKEPAERLPTNKALVFLAIDKDKVWRPVGFTTERGANAATGVIWFHENHCYRYDRIVSTSPLRLYRIDQPIQVFRDRIKAELDDAREWNRLLAISEPQARAKAMANLIQQNSSRIRGTEWPYLSRARAELVKLKEFAVPPLIEILSTTRPSNQLDQAVLVLCELGPIAKTAGPALIKVLSTPGDTSREYIIAALLSIGTESAAPAIREQLNSESLSTRASAAVAIAVFGDIASADQIIAAMPKHWARSSQFQIRDMLNALWHLDTKLAEPLIKKAEADPNLADIKDQLRRWDHKPPPKPPEEKF